MRRGPVVSRHEDCFEYNGTGKVGRFCIAGILGAGVLGNLVFWGDLRVKGVFLIYVPAGV